MRSFCQFIELRDFLGILLMTREILIRMRRINIKVENDVRLFDKYCNTFVCQRRVNEVSLSEKLPRGVTVFKSGIRPSIMPQREAY